MALKDSFRAKWETLDAKQRQRGVKLAIGVIGVALILAAYFGTGQQKKIAKPETPVAVISVGENRLQDDIRNDVEKQRQAQDAANKQMNSKVDEQGKSLEASKAQLEAITEALKALPKLMMGPDGKPMPPPAADGHPPDSPEQWNNGEAVAGQPGVQGTPVGRPGANGSPVNGQPVAPPVPEFVGDIANAATPGAPEDVKKKGAKKFWLPVSFMSARLLTGLKAKTVETARNDPEPMLLRVQAPAVLPNEVRAQLKGCLVVANGFGSLAAERIEAKLVSLSCYDYDDQSIIDADLKGIIVDKDGVKGLAGHVVMKAGANMARAMVAASFSAAGQALSLSATTTSTSALGSTQTIKPSEVGAAALGGGLSGGASEISKVFLDLVKQSAPVVEHGPDTDCTVVVTEGVWLEVKDSEQN